MSDVSIPGVKSKYETEKLIQDLMKVERIPRDRAAERLAQLEQARTIWLDLGQRMAKLRDSARGLFSFKNPFNERVAKSSDEAVLTATASREAIEETKTILVKQAAGADRFLSRELPRDYRVSEGEYSFTIGDKSVSLRFTGGSLKEFAEALTRRGQDAIRAQVIQVSAGTQSILIESLRTGEKNRLSFSGAALDLALNAGILESARSSRRDIAIGPSSARAWKVPVDPARVSAKDGSLSILAGGEARLPLDPAVASGSGLVLEFEARLTARPSTGEPPSGPPPGPSIPATPGIDYQGISIQGAPSEVPIPEWTAPVTPPRVDDFHPLYLISSSGVETALPEIREGEAWTRITIALADYPPDIAAIGLRNANTGRDFQIRSVSVYDPRETGGYRPLNPVGTARDAILVMDGIEIRRESNEIADLIPGVTLSLRDSSPKPVKLGVEPDREAIKNAIIEFVGIYNRAMTELNILGRTDERVVDEIDYFTDAEREAARKRLGLLQGDFTVSQLRSSMERMLQGAYPTGEGSAFSVLAQLGISTDARRPGAGYDVSRMRGYLEIDEEALDQALRSHFEAARQLFGSDTDGDLIADSGVAFAIDALLKPYVETGGIFQSKRSTLDGQITDQKKRIETLDRQLVAKEEELKRKYGLMEGSLGRMETTGASIQAFQDQSSGSP